MLATKSHQLSSILLLSFLSISFCIEEYSILLLPFNTKSLLKIDDEEDWTEPYQHDDEDWPYNPPSLVFNSSQFINKWFYNGLNVKTSINKNYTESYINMGNSLFSIEKCNMKKVISTFRGNLLYRPLNSDTYAKKEENMGNDVFSFVGDLKYKTTIQTGEKGNGINFYFNEKDNEDDLCANFGFNMDTTSEKTNLITQLKKKNLINKYIWTLTYQTEEDGIIVLGNEPHFYQNDTYLMSQYCEMKAIPNQSPDTAWSFKINEIRIKPLNSDNLILSDKKIDFLPDRGLIIGTDEYKEKIDQLIFDDLISQGICFSEETDFKDDAGGINGIYYVYYCDRKIFAGNQYTEKTYYKTFPRLEFYIKETNMTFTLTNDNLFYEIYNRSYFLVAFKKSDNKNDIWKLGEPFFVNFQFSFNQEKKLVGFYNPIMPRISNEEYMKELERNKNGGNNPDDNKTIIVIIVVSVIVVILIAVGAYFLGKKLNEIRKRRANELKDENFEYIASDNINDNKTDENIRENDVLGIEKD